MCSHAYGTVPYSTPASGGLAGPNRALTRLPKGDSLCKAANRGTGNSAEFIPGNERRFETRQYGRAYRIESCWRVGPPQQHPGEGTCLPPSAVTVILPALLL